MNSKAQTPSETDFLGDYEVVKRLDDNSFSKVVLARSMSDDTSASSNESETQELMVLKYGSRTKVRNTLKREYKALKMVAHKHIIKPLTCSKVEVEGNKTTILALPFLKHGDLFDIVERCEGFTDNATRHYSKQLVSALGHLHKHNIVHRDIKLENLLMNDKLDIELADFGFAELRQESRVNIDEAGSQGTKSYLAPEIFYDEEAELKSVDMFALGVTLFIMRMACPPFFAAEDSDPYYKYIMRGDWKTYWKKHPKADALAGMTQFKNLIQKLLTPVSDERLTAKSILKHSYMTPAVDSKSAKLEISANLR